MSIYEEAKDKDWTCPSCGHQSPTRTFELLDRVESETEKLQSKLALQEAIIKKMEEALEFYSNASNWFYPGDDFHDFLIAKQDISDAIRFAKSGREMKTRCGGKLARQTQKEVEQMKKEMEK